jgi:ribonuclease HII
LVAAAVCFDVDTIPRRRLAHLDDSKRCSPELREDLYGAILAIAAQVAVVVIPAPEIDRRGLHRCNLHGLARALEALDPEPDVCLTDGFAVPACGRAHRRVVGGDGTSAAIAAASVIAKVTRDRYMHRMAAEYPQYGFEHHVGYITPDHGDAVRKHGVTPLHRRSFQAQAYAALELVT